MSTELLLPDSSCLQLDSWTIENDMLVIRASTTQPEVACPYCGTESRAVHSYYQRQPADLPSAHYRMRLELKVRRFYCRNDDCAHTTFAERVPTVVDPYARRTVRLATDQTSVAFTVGGEAGTRLLTLLRMPTSPDTLLRLIRRAPEASFPTPRVLGVDDWAVRQGQNYGTILVDLESHAAIDLLPDRSAASLANWLRDHPGIEIISRDRGTEYIKGATLGAPEAVQVADRWHLLTNLREALEGFLEKKPASLQAAAAGSAEPEDEPSATTEVLAEPAIPQLTQAEQDKQARRQGRQERYDLVNTLHEEGATNREISRQLGLSYHTVAKYLRADSCPFYPEGRRRPSQLDPYLDYLSEQWQAGRRNASQLWREIRQQGFQGSRGLVARWAAQARQRLPQRSTAQTQAQTKVVPPLAPGRAVWLFLKAEHVLTPAEQETLKRMADTDGQVAQVHHLTQSFLTMLKERQSAAFGSWLNRVTESGVAALQRFADGLRKDLDAVKAALELPWSQGQVEGQVNRLKFIKRSMYGRANFDLLRRRVLGLPAASPN